MKKLLSKLIVVVILFSGCNVVRLSVDCNNMGINAAENKTVAVSGLSEPSGLTINDNNGASFYELFAAEELKKADEFYSDEITTIAIKSDKEKDTTQTEPKQEPFVLGGTAAVLLGLGAGVAGVFGSPFLFAIAALLLAAGAFLTAVGWKKIKKEPKKWKGEKFAIANYLLIGLVGVAGSFYLLWLLFDF